MIIDSGKQIIERSKRRRRKKKKRRGRGGGYGEKYHYAILKKRFIFFSLERQSYIKRRDKQVFHIRVHSSNGYNSLCWTGASAGFPVWLHGP